VNHVLEVIDIWLFRIKFSFAPISLSVSTGVSNGSLVCASNLCVFIQGQISRDSLWNGLRAKNDSSFSVLGTKCTVMNCP